MAAPQKEGFKVKVIAFYLPQYHETKENNEWWGEGFTEWTGVRNAKPLYPFHYQPTVPLDEMYYDLSDVAAIKHQARLAKEYGIYGFCIYHYWFNDETRLLTKPAEIILNNKEIDIRYCFSWANESWIRSWSGIRGNNWNLAEENKLKQQGPIILAKQEYGNESSWEAHFNYLLPFFEDSRYIRIDGMPVFILYKPENIPCMHSMLNKWNELARLNDLGGIYFVSTNNLEIQDDNLKANVIFEPGNYFSKKSLCRTMKKTLIRKLREQGRNVINFYSYDSLWKNILASDYDSVRPTMLGGMVGFDKTPREGRNAHIFLGKNQKKFKKYLRLLFRKSKERGQEFLFLNAWNEWGEGAYLEPDTKYGYKFLEAVKEVVDEFSKRGKEDVLLCNWRKD